MAGSIIKYLLKPYPHSQRKWVVLVSIPLFVSLFMVTFQPFGLQKFVHENKNLLLVGYGVVTLIVLIIDLYFLPLIFPKLFSEKRWYIISEVLYLLWILLSISIGNYLYSGIFSIARWNGFDGLLVFSGFTFAIGIIPIFSSILISYNYLLRKNLKGAGEISRLIPAQKDKEWDQNEIRMVSENEKQEIETNTYQLICIESEGNYINIWCIEKGKIMQHNLRNTIKNIEDQLKDASGLFRCHRAYIINLRYIEKVEGNSQGYQLKIRNLQNQVPVSRNYTKEFNNAFRSWK